MTKKNDPFTLKTEMWRFLMFLTFLLSLFSISAFAYGPIALDSNAKDVPSRERIYPHKPNPPPAPPPAPKMKLWHALHDADVTQVKKLLVHSKAALGEDQYGAQLKMAYLFYRMGDHQELWNCLKQLDSYIESSVSGNQGRIDQYPDDGET